MPGQQEGAAGCSHLGVALMPMFRLVSTAAGQALSVDYFGMNAAGVLNIAKQSRLAEADLWQENQYLFTLRRQPGCKDLWTIFRRPELSDDQERAGVAA